MRIARYGLAIAALTLSFAVGLAQTQTPATPPATPPAAPPAAPPAPPFVQRPGPNNAITDVEGIKIGHFTNTEGGALTGTTVILTEEGAVGGVDVRGGAPGTRETDLLNPTNQVEKAHAIMLSGGSAYGLDAAGGVMRYLEERGIGFPVGPNRVVPIVPAAILFDLGRGDFKIRPTADYGYRAAQAAKSGPVEQGNVGAGTGARAGGMKGGIGTASVVLPDGLVVGAIVAVNAVGSPINTTTGDFYARFLGLGNEFANLNPRPLAAGTPALPVDTTGADPGLEGRATTIGVVATNAVLTKAQAKKIAEMAQDGLARAIRPAHTMYDGDTIFALGTGKARALTIADVNLVGSAAADAFARAVVHAMLNARTVANMQSYCDRYAGACPR